MCNIFCLLINLKASQQQAGKTWEDRIIHKIRSLSPSVFTLPLSLFLVVNFSWDLAVGRAGETDHYEERWTTRLQCILMMSTSNFSSARCGCELYIKLFCKYALHSALCIMVPYEGISDIQTYLWFHFIFEQNCHCHRLSNWIALANSIIILPLQTIDGKQSFGYSPCQKLTENRKSEQQG